MTCVWLWRPGFDMELCFHGFLEHNFFVCLVLGSVDWGFEFRNLLSCGAAELRALIEF